MGIHLNSYILYYYKFRSQNYQYSGCLKRVLRSFFLLFDSAAWQFACSDTTNIMKINFASFMLNILFYCGLTSEWNEKAQGKRKKCKRCTNDLFENLQTKISVFGKRADFISNYNLPI